VKTFSISFAETSFDESAYARGVAKFLGTDHHEERLSANLAANLVSEIGAWMDEPLVIHRLFPPTCFQGSQRKHVTVALGGDGGDELFAGYPMYAGHQWRRSMSKCRSFTKRDRRASHSFCFREDEEPVV
jgi:asparagine synthase (glutamine-hydrolysing)